ncbi:MAG: IS4 family transposase, partial [Raineya sp.]|nr:IS4 family transposase [Raineya sp.]
MVLFVQAVLKIGVKSLLELAGALDSSAQRASSLRRIERFLKYFEFGIHLFGRMMIKVLGIESEKVYLLLDRTEWSLGKRWVNVLMLSVYVEGMSVPIFWRVYQKKGASNQQERIEFMNAFLEHFPTLQIAYLIADREFIGKEWFSYLQQAQIPFVIRLKENFQITHQGEQKTLKVFCRDVKACRCYYKGSLKICDTDMHLSVTALAGELLILGSLQADRQIFQVYQKRWGIETLFRALKTQGFTLENTAIYEARKVEKLLFLLSLAFV